MKGKNIFQYIGEVFCIYAVNMLTMTILTWIFGNEAQELSSMFTLGTKGIPLHLMVQFFALSIIIVAFKTLFFTDKIIKKMSTFIRTVLMLLSIIVVTAFFISVFGWFPVMMWEPWVMFLLLFGVFFAASTIVMTLKMKLEDKKMESGLERLKKRWEEEENDSGKQHRD